MNVSHSLQVASGRGLLRLLLEPDRANLLLAATVGLRKECMVRFASVHEGLAGLVAEGFNPSPWNRFRASALQVLRRSGEEKFQSFRVFPLSIAVPCRAVLVVRP